jgi:tyrosine-specific transport protein
MRFWESTATLVGMIVGAGVLGLPFVIASIGVFPGMIMLLVIGGLLTLLNLMFLEVILRSKFAHQVVGYTRQYLGKWMERLEFFSILFSSYGVLLAYIIGQGVVLSALFGMSPFIWSLIFFAIASIILYFGLNLIKVFELWMVIIFIVIILVIFGFSSSSINFANYQNMDLGWHKLLLAYGVMLFAFSGVEAIVPLRQILKKDEKKAKKAVLLGSLIPALIYIVFAFVVVGVTGTNTTQIATVGLGNSIGAYMLIFGNVFAVFAMGTSFLAKGVVMRELFMFDYKLTKLWSWLLIIIIPLIVFLIGLRDFINTISIVGGVSVGITGIVIVLLYHKAKKIGKRKPEFKMPKLKILSTVLIAMFVLGIVYTIYDLIV